MKSIVAKMPDRNLWLIDTAILLLGTAYGLAISIISIWLDDQGYTKGEIGTLAAWFALGIVAFSVPAGVLIKRFSAKAMLVASLLGYACTVGAFPFLASYYEIAFVRFFDGAFSVGIWVSCETILLQRAAKKHKAFVTSLYALAMAMGYVIGPLASAIVVGSFSKTIAFVTSGVISAFTGLLVLWRLDPDRHGPPPTGDEADPHAKPDTIPPPSSLDETAKPWPNVFWRIKSSCLATFTYGYFQAAAVLLLPLFLKQSKGFDENAAIRIPAFFAAGMLLFVNVAGRLGDKHGHLALMRILGAVGCGAVLSFVYLETYPSMAFVVFLGGASLASVAPVSLALQGIVTRHSEYTTANGIYNLFYAAGMLLGPPISFQIAERWGYANMLYHLAALWAFFVVFTIVFASDDPARRRRLSALAKPAHDGP